MTRLKTAQIPAARAVLLKKQKDRCALCRTKIDGKTKKACLDHCHKTGYVRGVLCNNCNGIEGKVFNLATRAKRDGTAIWWLERLLNYLKAHEEAPTGVFHPMHKTDDEKRVAKNAKARMKRARAKAKKNLKGK